jgi:membrane-associated phospholipid phosphatase
MGLKIIALDIFYAIMLAFGIYWILQFGLPMRPRPETLSSIPPLITHLPDNSFPSGHAIFAGASVVAIGYFLSFPLSSGFLVLGVCMCIARVIAGVHYFGDVLVGIILGALIARGYIALRDSIGMKTFLHTMPLKIASFLKL